jgi:hypothetical protein
MPERFASAFRCRIGQRLEQGIEIGRRVRVAERPCAGELIVIALRIHHTEPVLAPDELLKEGCEECDFLLEDGPVIRRFSSGRRPTLIHPPDVRGE